MCHFKSTMNALRSYSSDNDSDYEHPIKKTLRPGDVGTNYDDVGMDISEDSGDNEGNDGRQESRTDKNDKNQRDLPKTSHRSRSPSGSDGRHDYVDKRTQSGNRERIGREDDRPIIDLGRSNRSRGRFFHGYRDPCHRSFDGRTMRPNRDDRRGMRRSRSRSRDRSRHSHSRSRSRSRERRRRRSRSRSRDRNRRRPHEIRKEAQQKLAALRAANPDYDHEDLMKRGMEAQLAEMQKTTGLTLPSYYNPAVMNPLKIAEQERKKRLLWGNKSKADNQLPVDPTPVQSIVVEASDAKNAGLWAHTKFVNDSDGKMAEKFKRLMGCKAGGSGGREGVEAKGESDLMQKQETLFTSMEKQYEVARLTTHTQRGFGLGFSSQSYLPK